jgi:hypothetical protein
MSQINRGGIETGFIYVSTLQFITFLCSLHYIEI